MLAAIILSICVYFLIRFTNYCFSGKNKMAWQKLEIYAGLIVGLICYGGSIPWIIYLVLKEDHRLWLILPICAPCYAGLTWFVIKGFRYQITQIKSGDNPS